LPKEMDPKGKGMVVNDKEKESIFNEPRDDKPTDSGSSHKKKDGKKKRRYDSDASSSSPKDDDDDDSSSKKKTVNQNYSFDYSRMPYNSNAHLLSIPLRKPPHFDGEDYSFWSHKMRSHLFSLHPSIWEIVENGIKISHEGNDATMITKMELVEGELGRFTMIRGEEPTQTYNRLKTLVNKIRSYGSTRWTDHDVVRLMLRSFTIIDPHLVNLIRENPKYTKMTPEEILGNFVSGRMMVKEARYVDDALNGPLPIYEPQPVTLKATSSKEALPSKVDQVEAARLNEDEMALIIKRFKTALKGHKEYPNRNKTKGKHSASNAVRLVTLLQTIPIMIVTRDKKRAGRRRKRRTTGRQRARRTLERYGTRTAPLPTLTTKDLLPRLSTDPHSFPMNAIHVLWPRRKRYVFRTQPSTLHLVMKNPPMMK
jgi:hypothetical protein